MKRYPFAVLAASFLLGTLVVSSDAQPARDQAFAKYRLVDWSYDYSIRNLGTKSQGEGGVLAYGDKTLDAKTIPGLQVNDYMHTPWGTLYWWGRATLPWGGDGWLPHSKLGARGKRLDPPDAKGGFVLLAYADSDTTVRVAPGTQLGVHLPTFSPVERPWSVTSGSPEILRTTLPPSVRTQYSPGWGSLNKQVFHFNVVNAGKTTLVIRHDGPSGKEWKVNVEVSEK